MSRKTDDFLEIMYNSCPWVLLFGALFLGMCAKPVVGKKEPKRTPTILKSDAAAKIYTAQTPEKLARIMKLYGRFDKQKTAQFGVFARRMDKLNQGK